jgi:hypothetical protein
MSSKDVGIRIRVDKELREAFRGACMSENLLASDVLRDFMRSYANQHDSGKQASLFTGASSREKRAKPTLQRKLPKDE